MSEAEPAIAKAQADRRRYRRVRVNLQGRLFVPADEREARCKVIDLSPGGAAIECNVAPENGTPVVLYVDGFGRFEGATASALASNSSAPPPSASAPPNN